MKALQLSENWLCFSLKHARKLRLVLRSGAHNRAISALQALASRWAPGTG